MSHLRKARQVFQVGGNNLLGKMCKKCKKKEQSKNTGQMSTDVQSDANTVPWKYK